MDKLYDLLLEVHKRPFLYFKTLHCNTYMQISNLKNTMVKDVFYIEKLMELLIKVKQRPSMFCGKPSIELLGVFLNGYMLCKMETNKYADFFPGFSKFIENKYNWKSTDGMETIIRSVTTSDEEAFYKFFELLDEFMAKENETNF